MNYQKAYELAKKLCIQLEPHCDRIQIAGSIRRQKREVGDIEIVCIPRKIEVDQDLFTKEKVNCNEFVEIIDSFEKVKGDAVKGKYMQRILPEGIKVDIFTCARDNWGLIYAIRTGSAKFSHHVLASTWVKLGYHSKNGYLWSGLSMIPLHEEKDLFKQLRINYISPRLREV